ncbi:MAG: hypothetical protein A2287_07165 [Candidatus Melainabacteria bacterium RIFOXYA12_FULL_32_12]|nr:MAG: hypothetical protein A2255_00105 [Candidatus Melainabacteria bacterium RIFOXYA2_FULL_32_9]OGI26993.1 MAG: hypothetical protein A2287_07165 [Candidatus Melainabacteria bacterium RIFOXYA12_FULL_32_12]
MVKLNYFNITGGLNKFSSIASLNESEKKTDWYDAQNIEGHKSGGLVKMKGNINVNQTSLPANTKILGIFDYIKGGVHYPVVNTSEGKLYRLNLSTGLLTQVYTGLNQTAKCCYTNFNNGVIVTNGVNTPVFYEEGVGSSLLTGTPPVGLPIEAFKARVFIATESTLHYCALGNPNDWTTANDAGFIANFHNDSSPIIALKNYGEYLAIYKKQGIYLLTGSSPADFAIVPVSDKGSLSSWGIGTIDNNQFFFNGDSITPLRFNELGQVMLADDVSIKIKPALDELDSLKFNQVVCIPYQKKNQIWFYFSTGVDQNLDVCYIYDFFHNSWHKRVGFPVTCGTVIDSVIYTGTADGKILQEDYGDDFDGDAIEAWWYSPWFTFGKPGIPKEINSFDIWLYQDQNHSIDVLYSKNYGQNHLFKSISVLGEDDLIWDVRNWDSDGWSSSKAIKKRIRLNGKYESIQIGVRNIEANQPFTVLGFSFDLEVADL